MYCDHATQDEPGLSARDVLGMAALASMLRREVRCDVCAQGSTAADNVSGENTNPNAADSVKNTGLSIGLHTSQAGSIANSVVV